MAMKKRYHTVNGMLIGETSNGVRRGYLPDALGSVVATVDDNGAIENTYRYKPYGGVLAKTGAGADPKFMWTGSYGTRSLPQAHSDKYSRHRHFSSLAGRWTTIDPLGFLVPAVTPDFVYCFDNPTTFTDPTGLYCEQERCKGCKDAKDLCAWLIGRFGMPPDHDGFVACCEGRKPSRQVCFSHDYDNRYHGRPADFIAKYRKCVLAHEGHHSKNPRSVCPGDCGLVGEPEKTGDLGECEADNAEMICAQREFKDACKRDPRSLGCAYLCSICQNAAKDCAKHKKEFTFWQWCQKNCRGK